MKTTQKKRARVPQRASDEEIVKSLRALLDTARENLAIVSATERPHVEARALRRLAVRALKVLS